MLMHTTCNVTQFRVIHLQEEHYRNTSETHAQVTSMPSLYSLFWFKLALHIRQIEAVLGNTTSGVRPVVLLGAETRGSTLEQQQCSPITDVLLHRSTGSAPDTRLIWQMLRRKVRGQRESCHTHLLLPPNRHAAPSSTQNYSLRGGWQKKKRKKRKKTHFSSFLMWTCRTWPLLYSCSWQRLFMIEDRRHRLRGYDGNLMYYWHKISKNTVCLLSNVAGGRLY